MTYILGVPLMMLWGGYKIYEKNSAELDEKAERVKKIEDDYLELHAENMVKL
jgi:hypothetical protein